MKKVFVSSVIQQFENYRTAVRSSLEAMDYKPVMAENLSSRSYSSETACLTEVQGCDMYILILGSAYGYKTNQGLSVTHTEYKTALQYQKPILVFIQDTTMEPEQDSFKREVEKYDEGFFRTKFSSPDQLKDLVVKALRQWESENSSVDAEKFLTRIEAVLPLKNHSRSEAKGVVAFWGQPVLEIDLDDIESRADELFGLVCSMGAASLRNGYQLNTKPNVVSIEAGKSTQLNYYDDGLMTLIFSPEIEHKDHMSFSSSYASPQKFQDILVKAASLNASKVTWVCLGLIGMENRYFDEPTKSNSMTYPMHSKPYELGTKFFNPFTQGSYEIWLQLQIKKLKRTYSKNN